MESTMKGGPVVQVPEVSGIDLAYRPRNYFRAADLKVPLTPSIAGESRRQLVRALMEWDAPIPDGLDAAVLGEAMLEVWGSLHPSHMGGEYLPPLRKGEVEIARVSLQSVTADQISIRARHTGRRIGFRVVDEYPETSTYVCHPASSVSPLSLGELIALMESASEGGSIVFPILVMNSRYSTRAELATFVTVTSDFYPELGGYYRTLIDAWVEERA
jgi:hypothetical protein